MSGPHAALPFHAGSERRDRVRIHEQHVAFPCCRVRRYRRDAGNWMRSDRLCDLRRDLGLRAARATNDVLVRMGCDPNLSALALGALTGKRGVETFIRCRLRVPAIFFCSARVQKWPIEAECAEYTVDAPSADHRLPMRSSWRTLNGRSGGGPAVVCKISAMSLTVGGRQMPPFAELSFAIKDPQPPEAMPRHCGDLRHRRAGFHQHRDRCAA